MTETTNSMQQMSMKTKNIQLCVSFYAENVKALSGKLVGAAIEPGC
jgi:hypothetical protein